MVVDPIDGQEVVTMTALARKHGMSPKTLAGRVQRGIALIDALTAPVVRGQPKGHIIPRKLTGPISERQLAHIAMINNTATTDDAKARRAFALTPGERKHILATGWNPAHSSKRPRVQS